VKVKEGGKEGGREGGREGGVPCLERLPPGRPPRLAGCSRAKGPGRNSGPFHFILEKEGRREGGKEGE
jgi:hypothetical protein